MALLRREHRDFFHCFRGVSHWRLGERRFDAVGNLELLDEPAFMAVQFSQSVKPGMPDWQKVETFFSRWRPGGTAAGTWLSEAEKLAYRLILENGGNVIVLSSHGFQDLWHPSGDERQRLCAEGRLLFASPYEPRSGKLPRGLMRERCLELNALAKTMENACVL